MLATFANQLEVNKSKDGLDVTIRYQHTLRCPITVWFERSHKNKYGWVMQFQAKNNSLLKEFRSDLFKQAIQYIERRTRRPVTEISYEDLLALAGALEIQKIAA